MLIKHWQRYNDGAEREVESGFKVGAGGRTGFEIYNWFTAGFKFARRKLA